MPRDDHTSRYSRREVMQLLGGVAGLGAVAAGVDESVLQAIQRDNPRRFLAFVPA